MTFRKLLSLLSWLIIPIIFGYELWETFLTFLAWLIYMCLPGLFLYKYVSDKIDINDVKFKKHSMKEVAKGIITTWIYIITIHLMITGVMTIPLSCFIIFICFYLWVDFVKNNLDI